jgi:hypothetical protein
MTSGRERRQARPGALPRVAGGRRARRRVALSPRPLTRGLGGPDRPPAAVTKRPIPDTRRMQDGTHRCAYSPSAEVSVKARGIGHCSTRPQYLAPPRTDLDLSALAVIGSLLASTKTSLSATASHPSRSAERFAASRGRVAHRYTRVQLGHPRDSSRTRSTGRRARPPTYGMSSPTCRSLSSGLAAGRARATHRRLGYRCSATEDADVVRPLPLRRPLRGAVRPRRPSDR